MTLSQEEIVRRLGKIIDDLMDLAIECEFGSWEEFNNMLRDLYPDIPLPDAERKSRKEVIEH